MLWLVLTGCWGTATSPTGGDVAEDPKVPVVPGVQPAPGAAAPAPAEPGPDALVTADNCDDLQDGGPVAGPDCVTAKVSCGQRVIGHTKGGTNRFDRMYYQRNQCTPAFHDYEKGGERVYLLEMPPGDHHADVWLDTPCVDLDLAAFRLPEGTTCPDAGTSLAQCEMWPDPGTERDHVRLVSQGGSRWLLIVEGKAGAEGLFGLQIDCAEGL